MDILPGFRDFEPPACALRNSLFNGWREIASRFCFEEFDGPILEPLDLFIKKSGDEILDQLFAFEDKGGRKVALRPEMTPSLARILGRQSASLKHPTKWFNITENFRYERPQKGRLRSFYQFNADIIGEVSYAAEAELIALAIATFQHFGLTHNHFHVRLSDRGIWLLWLKTFGIEVEDVQVQMLSIFDKWERRPQIDLEMDLKKFFSEKIIAESFFQETQTLRQAHTVSSIRQCFSKRTQAATILHDVDQRLQTLQSLLGELEALNCKTFIKLDLTIVRGLAYYTGFVFEIFEKGNQGRALAGGGRYDQLFEKLTGHSMPAVGFAAGDVPITHLLQKYHLLPGYAAIVDCLLVFEKTERFAALQCAQQLRRKGLSVLYLLDLTKPLSKQLKKAYSEQPHYIIIFTHEKYSKGIVQVKNTADNSIHNVNPEDIYTFIKKGKINKTK